MHLIALSLIVAFQPGDIAVPVAGGWIVNGTPITPLGGGYWSWPGGWAGPLPGGGWGGAGLDTLPGVLPGNPWGLAGTAGHLECPQPRPMPWRGSRPIPATTPLPAAPNPYSVGWTW